MGARKKSLTIQKLPKKNRNLTLVKPLAREAVIDQCRQKLIRLRGELKAMLASLDS